MAIMAVMQSLWYYIAVFAMLRRASHLELAGGCASTNLTSAPECFSPMCFTHVWRASALLSADLDVLLQHSLVTAIKILKSAPAALQSHAAFSTIQDQHSHLLSYAILWGARQRKVLAFAFLCTELS